MEDMESFGGAQDILNVDIRRIYDKKEVNCSEMRINMSKIELLNASCADQEV